MNKTEIKGKEYLEKAMNYDNPEKREWKYAGYFDSYGEDRNRAQFWVLEGSPPRGFIIDVNESAIRLDSYGGGRRMFFKGDYNDH